MCNNCENRNCGCTSQCGCKPTLKYCGRLLPCLGVVKGDDYETVLEKIDGVACSGGNTTTISNCSLDVEILTVDMTGATSSVTGGTPPYSYKWKYAQNTFKNGINITDTSVQNITFTTPTACDMGTFPECAIVPSRGSVGLSQPTYYVPVYLTLKVKDSLGCVGQDSYMAYLTYYY